MQEQHAPGTFSNSRILVCSSKRVEVCNKKVSDR